MHKHGVNAGPSGVGALAALRRIAAENPGAVELGGDPVVVLLSAEGNREYAVPNDYTGPHRVELHKVDSVEERPGEAHKVSLASNPSSDCSCPLVSLGQELLKSIMLNHNIPNRFQLLPTLFLLLE